ncbi:MAG TPA: DHA2 family efflux MFS transporter permease subunit [Anaerolineae bacterium]|nr:DHA2 family efflux MFS transporter permease subunit [Anaerolineae bacterium]
MRPPRPNTLIALVSVAIFIGAMDLTVASAFLPQVVVDFELSTEQFALAGWVVTLYLAAYAVSMTFAGRLSDLYGRRAAYLVCLVIFVIGSALVALTQRVPIAASLEWLVASRVVQALGAGAMVPVSMALVGDLYPPEKRATPLGFIAAIDTAGWVVGHLYGGIMIRAFTDWRLIFWLNIPIGLLAFILCARALRDVPRPQATGRLDVIGATLIGAALAAFNIGVGGGAESGAVSQFVEQAPPSYQTPLLIASILLFVTFVAWELRTREPLLDLRLFRQRTFTGAALTNLLVGFVLIVALGLAPLFINAVIASNQPGATADQILSDGAWYTGWVLSGLTVTMALMSAFIGRIVERRGYRVPAVIGLLVGALGFWIASRWTVNTTYVEMLPGLMVAGLGLGMVLSPIATAVINLAPAHERGVASALVIILRLVGMSLGGSIVLTWGTQRVQQLTAELAAGSSLSDVNAFEIFRQATAQAVNESFLLFATSVCVIGVIAAWQMMATHPPSSELAN